MHLNSWYAPVCSSHWSSAQPGLVFYLTPGSIVRNTKRVVHRESVNGQQDRYQRYGVSQGVLQDWFLLNLSQNGQIQEKQVNFPLSTATTPAWWYNPSNNGMNTQPDRSSPQSPDSWQGCWSLQLFSCNYEAYQVPGTWRYWFSLFWGNQDNERPSQRYNTVWAVKAV